MFKNLKIILKMKYLYFLAFCYKMKYLYFLSIVLFSFNLGFGQNLKLNTSLSCDLISENYYGKIIEDPYQCIENLKDSLILKWFNHQSNYSKKVLNNIKGKDDFVSKFENSISDKKHWISRKHELENGRLFYLKAKKGEEYYKLYWKKSPQSQEQLLYDPKS